MSGNRPSSKKPNGNNTSQGMMQPTWEFTRTHDDRILSLLETGFQSDLTLQLGSEGTKVCFIYNEVISN